MAHSLALLLMAVSTTLAQTIDNPNYRIIPIAGSGASGDSGPASRALLSGPTGLAEDAEGNVYISEAGAGVIRRVRPDGTIERFAGSGFIADGDAGLSALATDLQSPTQLAYSPGNELFFFDSTSCRIRKVNPAGIIEDVAGSGKCAGGSAGGFGGGFGGGAISGTDGKALETDLGSVGAMVFDNAGLLIFSETNLHIVRRLDSDGEIRTIAGSRYAAFTGDSGAATEAALDSPTGLAVDQNNNLYIGDSLNCRIRRVDSLNYIDSVAGASACAGTSATFTGNSRTALERIGAIAYDPGSNALFIAMPRSYRIVRLAISESKIAPYIGNGKLGIAEPSAADALEALAFSINEPSGLLLSPRHGLLVASASAYHVYQSDNVTVTNFAGRWPQMDLESDADSVQLLQPRGLYRSANETLLFVDTAANRALRLNANGTVTPLAGAAYPAGYARGDNGPALDATLDQPLRIVERSNGDIYIAEATRIRVLTAAGVLKTVRSGLKNPVGMVFDSQGRLVYSECGSHRVMRLDLATNVATRIAGGSSAGFSGDTEAATSALLNGPTDVAYDTQGNLHIADKGNRRIRKVGLDGKINTFAGNSLPFSYGNITGQLALQTGFGSLEGMNFDAGGNLIVSESQRITKIAPSGELSVITGYLAQADDGSITYLDGPLNNGESLLSDSAGNIYFSVRREGTIKMAVPLNP